MRSKASLVIALFALGLAVLAALVAWGTITMDVDSYTERIAVCGGNNQECADRWEYAIGAFWAALYPTCAVGLGALAYIVARAGRTVLGWIALAGAGLTAIGGIAVFWGTLFFTEWIAL